jgi:hypothetical protein
MPQKDFPVQHQKFPVIRGKFPVRSEQGIRFKVFEFVDEFNWARASPEVKSSFPCKFPC